MGIFDSKHFNSEVFGKYLETVPRVKQNALLNAGILRNRADLKPLFTDQVGGNFANVPMTGRVGGAAQNYDGATDVKPDNIDTYMQGMIVAGRMKAWEEKDFSYDITGGKDFMEEIGSQVADFWDDTDQATLLSVLKGVFANAMPASHTLDISGETVGEVGVTTLNTAIQKAVGANKSIFTLAIMHSQVSTNLENLKLIEYAKYTDANGVEKNMALGTWNGRVVLVDDDVPVESASGTPGVYTLTIGGTLASGDEITCFGTKVTLDGEEASTVTKAATALVSALGDMPAYTVTRNAGVITFTEKTGFIGTGAPTASIKSSAGTVTVATTTNPVVGSLKYHSYILGQGAIDYCDCGAKVPNEVWRDPNTAGGKDELITRQRKLFAPRGFSFVMPSTPIVSPTDAELATATNWALVSSTRGAKYDHRAIPIARIVSLG